MVVLLSLSPWLFPSRLGGPSACPPWSTRLAWEWGQAPAEYRRSQSPFPGKIENETALSLSQSRWNTLIHFFVGHCQVQIPAPSSWPVGQRHSDNLTTGSRMHRCETGWLIVVRTVPPKVAAGLLTACGWALAACRRSLLGPVLNIKRPGAGARDPGIASPSADRWPPAPPVGPDVEAPRRSVQGLPEHRLASRSLAMGVVVLMLVLVPILVSRLLTVWKSRPPRVSAEPALQLTRLAAVIPGSS